MATLIRIAISALVAVALLGPGAATSQADSNFECMMDCAMRASQSLFSCEEQETDERCQACVQHRLPLCERCLTERCGIEDEAEVENSCTAHRAGAKDVC